MSARIKHEVKDLAVCGGAAAFDEMCHVGLPEIGDRDRLMQRISEVLDRKRLTNRGPMVREFETRLEEFLGVKHVVATCNGTIGLEVAERALGLAGEVIVPSFTFVATPHSLRWQGMTPVFCDIDPKTHTIDPSQAERLVTDRTTGMIGVHLWGRPCAVDELARIAEKFNLKLLFDAAHAFGCSHNGAMIGGFGHAEVFSFQATKFFNTLEGGAIATNHDDLALKLRRMKDFGFAGLDTVVSIGTNAKMSEISAAVGLGGLEEMKNVVKANRSNYGTYSECVKHIPGVRLIEFDQRKENNFQYVVIECDAETTGLSRDQLVAVLHRENIRARRYFWPGCHRMAPYASEDHGAGARLAQTETVAERVIVLPTGTAINSAAVESICAVLKVAVDNASEVSAALA